MSGKENIAALRRFTREIYNGNLDIIDELVAPGFFDHVPPAWHPTGPQVYKEISSALLAALPDLKISLKDAIAEGDTVTAQLTISGTHTGDLWGAPPSNNFVTFEATGIARFTEGKFAAYFEDPPARKNTMGVLQALGVLPLPEDMDKKLIYDIAIPEILLKLLFAGQVKEKECTHLALVEVITPSTDVCEQCVALGDEWPALRMCMVCGFIGCCDTSKNKHAKQHFEETGHPIFRSVRLAETWMWCYTDGAFLSAHNLDNSGAS